MLPHVAVSVPTAFVKALIKTRKLSQRPREFDLGVSHFERLRGAKSLVATPEHLSEGCSIKRAGPVLAVEVEDVKHAARLVREGHQLNAAGVEDTEDLLTELVDLGALFTANSGLLSRRQGHRGNARRLKDNDFD